MEGVRHAHTALAAEHVPNSKVFTQDQVSFGASVTTVSSIARDAAQEVASRHFRLALHRSKGTHGFQGKSRRTSAPGFPRRQLESFVQYFFDGRSLRRADAAGATPAAT
jgi:hypothetical protein